MTNNNDQVALASLAPNHRANAERLISCLPLLVLPAAAILARAHLAPWAFMWVLALAIFLACKWLTWFPHRRDAARAPARSALYLLAWAGMDAVAFLGQRVPPRLDLRQWLATLAKMLLGAVLLFILPRRLYPQHPIIAAFSAMPGLVLLIHFGGLHLIALAFQSRGINAQPLMLSPARAQSLADFWGRRWNTGFVTLSRDFLFRPLVPIIGATGATAITFLASGIVHDLVISLPARGGYGLPTLYFLIQFFGLLVQRSHPARWLGLARGIRGRAFTAAFILLPLPLLLHGPFIRNVILPFLHALGVLGSSAHLFPRKELIMPALSTLLLIGGVLHLGITSAGIVMTLVRLAEEPRPARRPHATHHLDARRVRPADDHRLRVGLAAGRAVTRVRITAGPRGLRVHRPVLGRPADHPVLPVRPAPVPHPPHSCRRIPRAHRRVHLFRRRLRFGGAVPDTLKGASHVHRHQLQLHGVSHRQHHAHHLGRAHAPHERQGLSGRQLRRQRKPRRLGQPPSRRRLLSHQHRVRQPRAQIRR
jgi:alginate O-acetyltransferase complex protein AlgI